MVKQKTLEEHREYLYQMVRLKLFFPEALAFRSP